MNLELAVLCLAGFGLVAAGVSVLVHLVLPLFSRTSSLLSERQRVGLWFGLSALPTAVGFFSLAVSLSPGWGLGSDHCLTHGANHPHLCPAHQGGAPGVVLFFIAAVVAARTSVAWARFAKTALLTRRTRAALVVASEREGDYFVFPSDVPEAFVIGLLQPRVFVSRALRTLGPGVSEPVLAHERVHAHRRDSLWRALLPLVSIGHLPGVAEFLGDKLVTAQEFAADEEAAVTISDGRLKIAEALLTFAKMQRPQGFALSFADGDVGARVAALLAAPKRAPRWVLALLVLAAVLVPILVGLAHDSIHHELEMLLGALS